MEAFACAFWCSSFVSKFSHIVTNFSAPLIDLILVRKGRCLLVSLELLQQQAQSSTSLWPTVAAVQWTSVSHLQCLERVWEFWVLTRPEAFLSISCDEQVYFCSLVMFFVVVFMCGGRGWWGKARS